jgi:pectate lyase
MTALLTLLGAATAAVTGCGTSNDGNGGNTTGVGGATGVGGTTGVAGAAGGTTGGTGGGVGTGTGGTTTTPDAGVGPGCSTTTPPDASELVGWAAANPMNPNGTTGGGTATPVTVTTTATFNSNAGGAVARVIYVTGSLTGNFTIGSNKTIIGLCGAQLHGHVQISGSTNVVLRNITIVGYGVGNCALDPAFDATVGCSSGADAISIVNGAQRIWIDHCDISDGTDGNLDITLGSNYVTVSWTKFHYTKRVDNGGSDSSGASGHRFSNLVGGGDNSPPDVGALNVTWHHDWWADNVSERQPRVRYGQNHIFNSLYSGAGDDYCVRAGMNAQLLVESNVFTGVASPQQFNSAADQATSFITANTNLYTATTGSRSTGGGGTPFTTPPYTYTLDDTAGLQAAIQAGAGPH